MVFLGVNVIVDFKGVVVRGFLQFEFCIIIFFWKRDVREYFYGCYNFCFVVCIFYLISDILQFWAILFFMVVILFSYGSGREEGLLELIGYQGREVLDVCLVVVFLWV